MTRYADIGPMHFPPSWHGGPPDPPDLPECEHEHTYLDRDAWGCSVVLCEDCDEEMEPEDTRSFYRDPDTGRVTW